MSGFGGYGRPDARVDRDLAESRLREAGYEYEPIGMTHDGSGTRALGVWRAPSGHVYVTTTDALHALKGSRA